MRFMPDLTLIRGLEERACNAWPALDTMLVDGWILRMSNGYTKRANSIAAYVPMPRPAEAVVLTAEDIYSRRGLACHIRTNPLNLAGDEAWLSARGYSPFEETLVMSARLEAGEENGPGLVLSPTPTPEWLAHFSAVQRWGEPARPTLERMISMIRTPAVFASLLEDGKVLAQGIAVVERGLVGLFDLHVEEDARGRGIGQQLTKGLMSWGRGAGANFAYLQVLADNAGARALYGGLGFTEAYRYLYWRR
jgi:N-acetylglutamate synthase